MDIIINTENVTIVSDQKDASEPNNKCKKVKLSEEERKERQKASCKKWREKNREHCQAYRKKYHEEHKEQENAYDNQRYIQNRDQCLAYRKAYYETNRDQCLARNKGWREKNPGYHKQWHNTHRDEHNAQSRFWADRTRHAHIDGYVPSSEFKRGFSVRDVTNKGYLYLVIDKETNAVKIGCTQCTPEHRLSYYRSHESDSIEFLLTSLLLADVYEAEKAAHDMLNGKVRHVRTDDKSITSTNPQAEWFQLDGTFLIEDVFHVFNTVSEQFACKEKKD